MKTQPENFETAVDAAEKGIVAIPCYAGTKTPCVKWKRYESERASHEFLKSWFRDPATNVAIVTTGMVLFDCETTAAAEITLQHCGPTPYVVQTPGGGLHLGYQRPAGLNLTNRVRILDMPIDIRTDGGLALIPPSVTDKGKYKWISHGLVPVEKLPIANVEWIDHKPLRKVLSVIDIDTDDAMVRHARAYLSCVEGAVSGQGGHDCTMRAASILVQKFGLPIELALPLIVEWNQRCQPPWSEKELLHKLQDAFRLRSHFSRGGL